MGNQYSLKQSNHWIAPSTAAAAATGLAVIVGATAIRYASLLSAIIIVWHQSIRMDGFSGALHSHQTPQSGGGDLWPAAFVSVGRDVARADSLRARPPIGPHAAQAKGGGNCRANSGPTARHANVHQSTGMDVHLVKFSRLQTPLASHSNAQSH